MQTGKLDSASNEKREGHTCAGSRAKWTPQFQARLDHGLGSGELSVINSEVYCTITFGALTE